MFGVCASSGGSEWPLGGENVWRYECQGDSHVKLWGKSIGSESQGKVPEMGEGQRG